MSFGLTVTLEWWQWLLMVLGAGFCWAFGCALAGAAAGRLLGAAPRRPPG